MSNVVYPFVLGGAEKRIYEIGRRLTDRGHEVTVYGRHFWDGPPQREHEGMTLRGVSPERDLYANDRRSIPEAIEFAAHVLRPLRRNVENHDVIVASVFPYFPVLSAKLATVLTDTPLVTTWHEVWGTYWGEYLGALAPGGKAVEYLTANVPQHPVAVSGVTADRLSRLGPSRERIDVVPNGIDFERIRSIPPATDGFDVLFAGRLIEHKHVDLLLEAFDHVAADYDVRLGIIGDGPETGRLQDQHRELDHPSRVSFLGFLEEYGDVLAHMRSADIFVSPSTREGFGITLAEAMAAGCTVIAANHSESAADEVVSDAGVLVEPTVDSLRQTLANVLDGHRPRREPVEAAREYDWECVTDRAEEVYRSTL